MIGMILYINISLLMFLVAIAHLLRRRKNMKVKEEIPETINQKDSAYNSMIMTEKVVALYEERGLSVRRPRELLELARLEYVSGNYVGAVEYSVEARKLLASLKPPESEVVGEKEKDVVKDISPGENGCMEIPLVEKKSFDADDSVDEETVEDVSLKELEMEAISAIKQRDEHLPAKFTLQMARDAVNDGKKEGISMDEAAVILGKAEEAYDGKRYATALSLANKAKKLALGEDIFDREEDPEEEKGVECGGFPEEDVLCKPCSPPQEFVCGSCENVVDEEDVFCRHCGSKLLETDLVCGKCGATAPCDSRFCPKCGSTF